MTYLVRHVIHTGADVWQMFEMIKMKQNIEIGDSIVVAIDNKALFGKVTDVRENNDRKPVIELKLDDACRYKIVWE